MARTFDAEDLLDSLLAIMVEDDALNTKIEQIEQEKIDNDKGLTPTLAPVEIGSYYLQTWTDKVLNTSPAIFYGIEDVQTVDGIGAAAKTYKCFIEIVLIDSGMTNDSSRRINRYARALEELFLANYAPAINAGRVKLDTVRPISFKLELDSDTEIKVGGISLTVTLV